MYGPGGRRAGSASGRATRHGSRPSARTRGYRSSLGGHDTVELRFVNLTRYAGTPVLLRVNALNDRNMEYGALFLDSVTTQVSGVWVEFVLYSTLINLASRGRQRRLLGFCTSECIGSNH